MIKGPWRVLIPCVNQDTGKWFGAGETIEELSEAEVGRLLAFSNIESIEIGKKRDERKKRKAKSKGKPLL